MIQVIRKGETIIPESKEDWVKPLIDFLEKWESRTATFQVQTSGSTGRPKTIDISRSAMLASAQKTNRFFKTNQETKALLPIAAKYIGGKMMLVRAIAGKYDLFAVKPADVFLGNATHDFSLVSMVPYQLSAMLQHSPKAVKSFQSILLGGSAVPSDLEAQIQDQGLENIYLGFGMTETVSHFALRKMGAESPTYRCLEGVAFGSDEQSRLWVDIPGITNGKLQTNDIIESVSPDSFFWRGRADWVINSGGIKIHPEELEKQLGEILANNFVLSSLPDDKLGEKLVLVIEGKLMENEDAILEKCKVFLPDYHSPKTIITVPEFPLTESGKVNRMSIRKMISNN